MNKTALMRFWEKASALYIDRFDIDEFPDAVAAQFAAIAGLLDAAERQARI
jgi:hypothetical protein